MARTVIDAVEQPTAPELRLRTGWSWDAAVALAGALSAVIAAIITAHSPVRHADLAALARALAVAVPIGAGLFAQRYSSMQRFGGLLVIAGFGWFVTTLAESSDATVYSAGRVAGWIVEPGLVYLLLAFPSGRLTERVDQALVAASAAVVAILFLPTALLVDRYPAPTPWSSCTTTCPRNAFQVVASEPGFVGAVVTPMRETLLVVLFGLVAARLLQRMRAGRRLVRRTLGAVFAVAVVREIVFALAFIERAAAPDSTLTSALAWLLALSLPVLALAFVIGIARWRLFMGAAMHDLAVRLSSHPGPEELRAALAGAFDDDSLEIVYRVDDPEHGWADAAGRKVPAPVAAPGRAVTHVRDRDRSVAAIVHDAALRDEHDFIDTASAYATMTLENHRLGAQTAALLHEVEESRARIQSSADEERRRIEHDLHDGAQQRLVALRIKLELAAERVGSGEVGPEDLRRLGKEVEDALDEVRSLARGIYPAPLADRGLVEALRSAALYSALPATVLAAGVRRYSRQIETAAYFYALEALQNASKHAKGATAAVVELSDNGSLRVDVLDDGAGFDPRRVHGTGLAGMRDRIEAVGGTLAIASQPGRGTRVSAVIPVPWPRQ